MDGIRRITNSFDPGSTLIPVLIGVCAVIGSTTFGALLAYFDVVLEGSDLVLVAGGSSLFISIIGVVAQYRREKFISMQRKTLAQLAATDVLTGALNRRAFCDRVDAKQTCTERNAVRSALILADVDHFKRINDQYGHNCGDMVLQQLAALVNDQIREGQDHFARWGGEEFAVYLDGISGDTAYQTAQRIRMAIDDADFKFQEESIKVSASFGLVDMDANVPLENVIQAADEALYEAKRAGRNCLVSARTPYAA